MLSVTLSVMPAVIFASSLASEVIREANDYSTALADFEVCILVYGFTTIGCSTVTLKSLVSLITLIAVEDLLSSTTSDSLTGLIVFGYG